MVKRRKPDLWTLSLDAFALSLEAQQVIALRMAKFAMGADPGGHEARRMVAEKASAAVEAHVGLVRALATGDVADAPGRTLALYRRKVRANRRRLSRG
jgi:hypothetical protein